MSKHTLNNILFFLIPALLPLWFFGAEAVLEQPSKEYFYGEYGLVEGFQETNLLISLILAIVIFCRLKSTESKWLKIWIGIAIASCFYILVEEISWGQKFFQWNTPEKWAELNTQSETNFHNMSQLLNRVPRSILEVGILVGGLVIPAFLKWNPAKLPEQFSPIYPWPKIAFFSAIAFIIKFLEQFPGWFDIKFFWRKSEVMEVFLYYFIFLYLVSIFQKWKSEGRFKS